MKKIVIHVHQPVMRDTKNAPKAQLSLAVPVRVAELDQSRKNIGHKEPLGVVRRKLHHVAPVLPEGPLVLRVFQMVCKPESRNWKRRQGYYVYVTREQEVQLTAINRLIQHDTL